MRHPAKLSNILGLIKKVISKGKYLYTCFADFQKAYDSLCRKRLLHRLKEIGLIGKVSLELELERDNIIEAEN